MYSLGSPIADPPADHSGQGPTRHQWTIDTIYADAAGYAGAFGAAFDVRAAHRHMLMRLKDSFERERWFMVLDDPGKLRWYRILFTIMRHNRCPWQINLLFTLDLDDDFTEISVTFQHTL